MKFSVPSNTGKPSILLSQRCQEEHGSQMRAGAVEAKPVARTCGHRGKRSEVGREPGKYQPQSRFLVLMPLVGLTQLEARRACTV